jgi:hypothetical protein
MNRAMAPQFVIVSGIPGSGKTTLGRKLALALRLPFYDKDEILEGLFEAEGVGDVAWRGKLSRRSDDELVRAVTSSGGAVVVSFWRTKKTGEGSGTPVEWIRKLPGRICEIHCTCDPLIAAGRFNGRRRHVGHLDGNKPTVDPAEFRQLASAGPLRLGEVTVIDTSGTYDLEAVVAGIRARFSELADRKCGD